MISFNISFWELALIIIAIAFVVGTIYLVKVFRALAATLDASAKMIDENRAPIKIVMNNIEDITKETAEMTESANHMTSDIEGTLSTVKNDVIDPVVKVVSTVTKVVGKKKVKKAK